MPITGVLSRSDRKGKKWKLVWSHPVRGKIATVHFGQKGSSDFTLHKDPERKKRYLDRHRAFRSGTGAKENWSRSGYKTAGWASRWILWNRKSIGASLRDIKKRFGLSIRK